MTAVRPTKANIRQWEAEVSYGIRGRETAPSDVVLGPPGPVPPAPGSPAPVDQRRWRPLGPFAIPHGQMKLDYTDPRHGVAGRVSAIAIDPGNSAHLLAGAAGGGIWRSLDRGASWSPRSDAQRSLAIGALAFDPRNPAIVYAGTGEGNALAFLGDGVLRSTNRGQDWSSLARAPFIGTGFFELKVDPEDSTHLLAATTSGLFESKTSGANWLRSRASLTWSVSFHPATGVAGASKEVFAACRDGLHVSTDGGTNFNPVPGVANPPGGWARLAVAHAPNAPNVVWVCGAGFNVQPPPPASLPRCDAGHLFRRPAAGQPFGVIAFALPPGAANQADYDWAVTVAPDNAEVLWLGATDLFTITRTPATNAVALARLSPTVAGDATHADQHVVVFDPADASTVYLGNDGGVYRARNRGASFESLNRGLAITEFEFLAQHPQVDAWLLGGTQDNGTQRYEGTGTWYHVSDGDGGDVAVDEHSPTTVYHERFSRGTAVIHNLRSRTGGGWETWRFNPAAPANHPTHFYAPMEARGQMLVQAGQDVFISDQEGTFGTFSRITIPPPVPAPPSPDLVNAITILDADHIAVGTDLGRVFVLTRAPAAPGGWTVGAAAVTPFAHRVSDLHTAPEDPGRIWATYDQLPGNAVARSDDGGANFVSAQGDLPVDLRAYAVAGDPANPPTVWVATDRGVYRSTDRGAHWTVAGAALPNCQVKDLVLHPIARVLRAATKSRGAWELEVDLPPATVPDVFIRYHPVDTGRALPAATPAPVETPDPFTPAPAARWWESPDVKLDAAPHLAPALGALEVDVFADDHGVAAKGLFDELPVPGSPARVYVQVHNRSAADAADVDVRVFFAASSIGAPPLPAGFWTGWPANAPGAGSAWQPVAAAARLAVLEAGRSRLAAFDWAVPADLPDGATLMAVAVPAGGAPFAPAPTTISELLTATNRIGIAGRMAMRPLSGAVGPRPGAVQALVHASAGLGDYALEVDAGSAGMVVGAVLSTALSNLAAGAGAVPLVEADHRAFGALLTRRPALGGQLDRTQLYVPPARGPWLSGLALTAGDAEPLVLLITRPQPPRGRWCVVQRDAAGIVRGGLTLVA